MYLLPAIDVLGGDVVRLLQGRYDAPTTYGSSVDDQLALWAEAGADRIHIIDLDAARTGVRSGVVWDALDGAVLPVQLGGGIRDAATAAAAVDAGAWRVIMGTAVVWNPDEVARAVTAVGARAVVAAVDVRDGRATGAGWLDEGRALADVVSDAQGAGAEVFLVTSVARDGTLGGPDFELIGDVRAAAPDAELMAAGGIATIEHLRQLAGAGVDGAVLGRSIYEGTIELAEALAAFA